MSADPCLERGHFDPSTDRAALDPGNPTAPRGRPRKRGLRAAVNDYCRWCIYDPASGLGTWRQQTQGCTATDCPLWPVRPMSASSTREEAA